MSKPLYSNDGPLIAAAQFAAAFDREHPDKAGEYPKFWRERIEAARTAGFTATAAELPSDYYREWEERREAGQQSMEYTPVAPEDDPFREDDELSQAAAAVGASR